MEPKINISLSNEDDIQNEPLMDDIDIDKYNKEIDEAMAEYRRGEYYTHEQVVEMAKKW